ncbi:MAG: hypothetical protein H3C57_03475, partial [Gammaproteobacteria bacterium]|nr:hypothetical protein [Gammaproteobacteria bacterium]
MDTGTGEDEAMAIGQDKSTAAPPAHARLIKMSTSYWISRLLYAAARLELADHLAGGARTATELA